MTVQTEYECLRDEFIKISKPYVSPEALEEIKNEYLFEIGSKRKSSGINKLERLIKVLEKCGILCYDNIKVFHDIEKRYINALYLQIKLRKYEDWLNLIKSSLNCNMYLNDNVQPSTSNDNQKTCDRMRMSNSVENHNLRAAREPNCNYINQDSKLKETVILKVSEQLGRSWRDVCRHMGIKEYQIDEIQNKYPYDLKEQSIKALQICISQYHSDWKINILHALEKGRRKDIKELVEKILIR